MEDGGGPVVTSLEVLLFRLSPLTLRGESRPTTGRGPDRFGREVGLKSLSTDRPRTTRVCGVV